MSLSKITNLQYYKSLEFLCLEYKNQEILENFFRLIGLNKSTVVFYGENQPNFGIHVRPEQIEEETANILINSARFIVCLDNTKNTKKIILAAAKIGAIPLFLYKGWRKTAQFKNFVSDNIKGLAEKVKKINKSPEKYRKKILRMSQKLNRLN